MPDGPECPSHRVFITAAHLKLCCRVGRGWGIVVGGRVISSGHSGRTDILCYLYQRRRQWKYISWYVSNSLVLCHGSASQALAWAFCGYWHSDRGEGTGITRRLNLAIHCEGRILSSWVWTFVRNKFLTAQRNLSSGVLPFRGVVGAYYNNNCRQWLSVNC